MYICLHYPYLKINIRNHQDLVRRYTYNTRVVMGYNVSHDGLQCNDIGNNV